MFRLPAIPERPGVPVRRPPGLIAGLAGVAAGPAIMVGLAAAPRLNGRIVVPVQHFYIVSGVSILAAALAAVMAVAVVQIALYRILFLALGFLCLAGIFAVHGLTTPGILGVPREYAGGVVGISAALSLAVPALLFAAAYLPGFARLERRLPFWPAGWLVALAAVGVMVYGAFALAQSEAVAELPLGRPGVRDGVAAATTALLLFAAARQWRIHRRSGLATQASLAAAFLLLAEAQVAMAVFAVWTLAWWAYHLLMLAAVALALRALAIERARGRSLRSIWEAALELEVSVGLEEIDVEAVAALVAAVEVKDPQTQGHNRRVAELAVRLGREIGLSAPDLRVLARAGLLHDVGKLGIPDAILRKAGPLDAEEWAVMKTHPELGTQILLRTGRFRRELLAVLHHHERMDGSGYPHGLAGDGIPLEARIIAVADTFDVLTSDRPYRRGRDRAAALAVVREESGPHLDPRVVAALMKAVGAAPAPAPLSLPETATA